LVFIEGETFCGTKTPSKILKNKVANYFVGEAKYYYKLILKTIHEGFLYATFTVLA
jgi:hypothetical protein